MLTSIAYYLGAESYETLCDAIDNLSFCHIIDRQIGEYRLTNEDRVTLKIIKIPEPPYGAILFLAGLFTNEERSEIANLGKYDSEAMSKEVGKFVAEIASDMLKKGKGIERHHLLSKADALPEEASAPAILARPTNEPANIPGRELLQDMQSSLSFRRKNAAAMLGNLEESSTDVVLALLVARETDAESEVREAAAVALDRPAHQKLIVNHPEIIAKAKQKIKALTQTQEKTAKHSYSLESISDFFKDIYDNLPEMIQIPVSLLSVLIMIVLIVFIFSLVVEGLKWLWMTLISNPIGFLIGVSVVGAAIFIAFKLKQAKRN